MSWRRHESRSPGGRVCLPVLQLLLALGFLTWFCPPLAAGAAGVDLRVVDEMAPPGGLAVIRVELTEPKPISRGRIRLGISGGALGRVVGAAMLNDLGDLEAQALSLSGEAVLSFTSSDATLGTSPELPILIVAVEVSPTAAPGESMTLALDLPSSEFFDPAGAPYPAETKSGTFTVGGLSITGMNPLTGSLSTGETIRIEGRGFHPAVDVNIQGADLSAVTVLGSTAIEATLAAPFQLMGTTRVRLRNPDDMEDVFYPAVLATNPPGNSSPLAISDQASIPEDDVLQLDVLSNDSDPDGDAIELVSLSQPMRGTAATLGGGLVEYRPERDFNGLDSFTYTIRDARGAEATAEVSVRVDPVNDLPVAVQDEVIAPADTPILMRPLDNDTDVEGDPLVIGSVSSASAGNVFLLSESAVWYVPHPLFRGVDSFTYTVLDGEGIAVEGIVSVDVRDFNRAPVAVADGRGAAPAMEVEIDVLANDHDPDGDPLTVELSNSPTNGVVRVLSNGVFAYQSNPGFSGSDSFDYRLSDTAGLSSIGSVTVAVGDPAAPSFDPLNLELINGTTATATLTLPDAFSGPAGPGAERVELHSTPEGILRHPSAITVDSGSSEVSIPLQTLAEGTAVVGATIAGQEARLVVVVRPGSISEVPVANGTPGLRLGLALTNRGSRSATVELNGIPTQSGASPVRERLSLAPDRQTAFLLSDLAAFSSFEGWVEVASSGDRVFPVFLLVGNPVRGYAGASRLETARMWAFPGALLAGAEGVLSLINNNIEASDVELVWTSAAGELTLLQFSLPAGQSQTLELNELLPTLPEGSGHALARSSEPLSAYLRLTSPTALWGQAARRQAGSQQLFAPHAVSGQGWFTELTLSNLATESRTVEVVWVEQPSGVQPGATLIREVTVAAGATNVSSLAGLFQLPEASLRSGSLSLTTGGQVLAFATLGNSRGLRTSVPVLDGLVQEALFSQAVSGPAGRLRLFTGLAFHNPQPDDAVIVADIYQPDGELAGHAAFVLPAGQRTARLVQQLVTLQRPLVGGYVRVRSTQPVAVVEMFGDFSGSFLSTVDPAQE